MEEELKRSHKEASDYLHMYLELEKELKTHKDNEKQMKPKRNIHQSGRSRLRKIQLLS
nr:serine/threonine-protein kinase TOUSLED isoform X1 [Ipomoea batatas]